MATEKRQKAILFPEIDGYPRGNCVLATAAELRTLRTLLKSGEVPEALADEFFLPAEACSYMPDRIAFLGLRELMLGFREDDFLETLGLLNPDDPRQPGMLPVLQETMRRLWDRRVQRLLTLSAYKALGGITESGVATSLALVADGALGVLRDKDPRCETIARRIFLRLVQFGEHRISTRQQERTGHVDALIICQRR